MADFVVSLRFNTKEGQAQLQKFATDSKSVLSRSLTSNPSAANLQNILSSGRSGLGDSFREQAQKILDARQRQIDPLTGRNIASENLTTNELAQLNKARETEINLIKAQVAQQRASIKTQQVRDRAIELTRKRAEAYAQVEQRLERRLRFNSRFQSEREFAQRTRRDQAREFAQQRNTGRFSGTFDEFLAGRGFSGAAAQRASRLGGSDNPLGISRTATALLAVSSVVGPLNSQRGALTMQAGFAAFSLGPIPALLSLMSGSLAGFIELLKRGVRTAKEAGLETREYWRATTQLQVQFQTFFNVIGVKTQEAFVPVIQNISELGDELSKLPWDSLIQGAAGAANALVFVTKNLVALENRVLKPFQDFSKGVDRLQEILGLEGSQKISGSTIAGGFASNGILGGWGTAIDELRQVFQDPKTFEGFQPRLIKFDMSSVEDLGRKIQESIPEAQEDEESDECRDGAEGKTNLVRSGAREDEAVLRSPVGFGDGREFVRNH